MKKIKIFLASSIDDLREDRLQVGDFFRQLNEIYLDSGIHFSLIKCEDYDNSIVANGKQAEYDREISESELVFFLFFRKVGDYTKHEFDIALESFKTKEKPKIITYFKYVTNINEANDEVKLFMQLLDGELKHYYNTYGHIDTLKLGILLQIKLMSLDASEFKIQDGEVLLNGNSIVKTANVPILNGNKTLHELTQKKQELQALLSECRTSYLADPSEKNENDFFNASAELNKVSKQLTEIEKQTLDFMSTVAEMTSDGKVLTYRQKEALKYFNQGDYDKAQAVLSDEERENELQRAENRAELAIYEIAGYIEEQLLWIKAEENRVITHKREEIIISKFKKIVTLTDKYSIYNDVFYEYADFLFLHKHYTQAIRVAEKARTLYQKIGNPTLNVSKMYNLLGCLYYHTHQNEKSEKAFEKASEVLQELINKGNNIYRNLQALFFYNRGVLYIQTKDYTNAEKVLRDALDIWLELYQINERYYAPHIIKCYIALGGMHIRLANYDIAEQLYNQSIELFVHRNEEQADTWMDHSNIYNNLSIVYMDTNRYDKAKDICEKAIEIRNDLYWSNPQVYCVELAESYSNLGIIYTRIKKYKEALIPLLKAKTLVEMQAKKEPNTYAIKAKTILIYIGEAYMNLNQYDDAKKYYDEAKNIYKVPYGNEALDADLADSEMNLGVAYIAVKQAEKAEECFLLATKIYKGLYNKKPSIYEQRLAASLTNLGMVYHNQNKTKEMTAVFKQVLPVLEKIESQHYGTCGELIKVIKSFL